MRQAGSCRIYVVLAAIVFLCGTAGCKSKSDAEKQTKAGSPPFMSAVAAEPPQIATDALPAEKTGGFDGKAAYEHVAKMVLFGPRPAGSATNVRRAGLNFSPPPELWGRLGAEGFFPAPPPPRP